MRDAGQVHRGQGGQHAHGHAFEGVGVEGAVVGHDVGQAVALDVLAYHVELVAVPARVQDPGDVRARHALRSGEPGDVVAAAETRGGREQFDHPERRVVVLLGVGLLAEEAHATRAVGQAS